MSQVVGVVDNQNAPVSGGSYPLPTVDLPAAVVCSGAAISQGALPAGALGATEFSISYTLDATAMDAYGFVPFSIHNGARGWYAGKLDIQHGNSQNQLFYYHPDGNPAGGTLSVAGASAVELVDSGKVHFVLVFKQDSVTVHVGSNITKNVVRGWGSNDMSIDGGILYFGLRYGWTAYDFIGTISNVKLWNVALTDADGQAVISSI